jgi:transposase
MSKSKAVESTLIYCGIDVSAATLAVALVEAGGSTEQRQFSNDARGHRALIGWLGKQSSCVRVSLEATGIYSLDLALVLSRASGVELAVLNPKLVNRFAQTLRRSKTDAADALVLAEYSRRMPFAAWQPPALEQLQLRAICRQIAALTVEHTRTQNRLHSVRGTQVAPRCVVEDLKRAMAQLDRRLKRLRGEARRLIEADEQLAKRFRLLLSIPGIGEVSAVQILGEVALLAAHMTVRQWVAYSGLDPVQHESGTSVHRSAHISRSGSRHLRRALYMPALVAAHRDPYLRAFYEALQARRKSKLQALMAVARKMLHAIYGIFRSGLPYDGKMLLPEIRLKEICNPIPS